MDKESDKPAEPLTLLLRKSRVQARIEGLGTDFWREDDYSIIDGETCVGRIYPELIHGEPKWRWFLQTGPAPPANRGVTDTLEDAKVEFKKRYLQVRGRV